MPSAYERSASQEQFSDPDETIIFFDWDDTLLPSCWLQDNEEEGLSLFEPPPQEERFLGPLRRLEAAVGRLLSASLRLGKVVIVTNAESPWVEMSCQLFMPAVEPLLENITVLYARDVYNEVNSPAEEFTMDMSSISKSEASGTFRKGAPGMQAVKARGRAIDALVAGESWAVASLTEESIIDFEVAPRLWKEAAFRQEISKFYAQRDWQSWKNVISVGDAYYERDAMRNVAGERPSKTKQCRTKTIKTLDEPDADMLVRQLKVVHDAIGYLVAYPGNVDIFVTDDDLALQYSE